MSAKRLRWAGIACVALSALSALLGYVVQVGCVILLILLHTTTQVPVDAVGGAAEPTVIPIPRIWPWSLLVAGFLLATGLALLFESYRRGTTNRCPAS